MEIDQTAPLIGKQKIRIHAPLEKVWELESNINRWSRWQKGVTYSEMHGPLEVGSEFRWKANGLKIASQLVDVKQHDTITWTGKAMGLSAIHTWHFEGDESGTTVTTEESMSGWLAQIIKIFSSNFLNNSLENALKSLKKEAERG